MRRPVLTSLEAYARWIRDHGNSEEAGGHKVVEEILQAHGWNWTAKRIFLFPHFILKLNNSERRYVEFDLIIRVHLQTVRFVAVEFKESNIYDVVRQAYERYKYVNYAYAVSMNRHVHVYSGDIEFAKRKGVGYVVNIPGVPVVLFRSKYHKIQDPALINVLGQKLIVDNFI